VLIGFSDAFVGFFGQLVDVLASGIMFSNVLLDQMVQVCHVFLPLVPAG
jgi:hypothetical protein